MPVIETVLPRVHATLCLRLEGWPKASYFFTKECVRPHAAYAAVVVACSSCCPLCRRAAGENLRLVRARAPSTVGRAVAAQSHAVVAVGHAVVAVGRAVAVTWRPLSVGDGGSRAAQGLTPGPAPVVIVWSASSPRPHVHDNSPTPSPRLRSRTRRRGAVAGTVRSVVGLGRQVEDLGFVVASTSADPCITDRLPARGSPPTRAALRAGCETGPAAAPRPRRRRATDPERVGAPRTAPDRRAPRWLPASA